MAQYNNLQELFSEPARWHKGSMAQSADGTLVRPTDEKAVSFCLLGGAVKLYYYSDRLKEVLNKLLDEIHSGTHSSSSISGFNDTHTYEEVLALVTKLDV